MTSLPPFTHHQMLALSEPFVRAGWQPDLAASDRTERRLLFRPRLHAPRAGLPELVETLALAQPEAGRCTLIRTLAGPHGLTAALQADGDDPAVLLARVAALPPQRLWLTDGDGDSLTALGARLGPARAGAGPAGDGTGALILRSAEASVGGLRLQLRLSGVSGYPAELELQPAGAAAPAWLPDDLLAVLGRPWARLTRLRDSWQGSIALRGAEPRRSRDAEARLRRTVAHLASTLAEPPARFHQRHRWARWRVALMGMAPLAIGLALVAVAWWAQRQGQDRYTLLQLVVHVSPPLLLGLFFLRTEMPRIEWPRIPLQPRADAWRAEATAGLSADRADRPAQAAQAAPVAPVAPVAPLNSTVLARPAAASEPAGPARHGTRR